MNDMVDSDTKQSEYLRQLAARIDRVLAGKSSRFRENDRPILEAIAARLEAIEALPRYRCDPAGFIRDEEGPWVLYADISKILE